MKKNFLLLGGLLMAFAFTIVSCSDDDVTPSKIPTNVGELNGGTSSDNDLPSGYRIASVGDLKFGYDEKGRLSYIDDDGDVYEFKGGKLSYEDDGENVDIALSGNVISKMAFSYYDKDEDGYEKGEGTYTFSYNANKQLTSITMKYSYEEKYDGKKETGTGSGSVKCTYSGKNLTKVVESFKYSEGNQETDTYKLSYDGAIANPFFQYTPNVVDVFEDAEMDWFFYLGLLGRASAQLPSKIDVEHVDIDDDGKEYNNKRTDYCGPYTFNDYGALKSADGESYTYTTNSSSKAVSEVAAPSAKKSLAYRLFQQICHRKHAKK